MLLEEEQGVNSTLAGPGGSESKQGIGTSASSEEEEESSGASTGIGSPETPVFQTKMKRGSSANLMQLAEDAAGQEKDINSSLTESSEQEESKPLIPTLLNGSQYEQPLQLQTSHSSLASATHPGHEKRFSYLQDQFPPVDGPEEEEPLTLEDSSEHEHQPLLSANSASAAAFRQDLSGSSSRSADPDHPLLRQGHRAAKDKLSKMKLPEKAKPPASHQKTNSVLEEEGDYYPNPDDFAAVAKAASHSSSPTSAGAHSLQFTPHYPVTKYLQSISQKLMKQYDPTAAATWIGFWALFLVTCSNYVLMPMRDAIALAVGVEHIPKLTLASTVLAVFSSVPIGWLFEAPDPSRPPFFKRFGMTRGETQGTSLALFYRVFAMSLCSYAIGFKGIEFLVQVGASNGQEDESQLRLMAIIKVLLQHLGKVMYIAFFLFVHLMKLHSLSLLWGVTTEAMEYEENARKRHMSKEEQQKSSGQDERKARLQRLAFVGFGGTVGGILGSIIASSLARVLRLSGLLILSALMLEGAAQLAIELGHIMHKHWVQKQLFPSDDNLASLDPSMKRSSSLGSMKRIASGNSLSRVKSMSELKNKKEQLNSGGSTSSSLQSLERQYKELEKKIELESEEDSGFSQRLLRGIRTILQSRLLMAIFTYNALYASTTVLLSFQRAELVANRKAETSTEANTAFLANINMASSVAVFALQSSGIGAYVAHLCGTRGTLALMPTVRLLGVLTLAYWHQTSNGEPPNLLLFLLLDECCRVMNMAVAKPVRESLWRGLSNEARYEAKPIVDTLANRWGGGSAAFLVSSINKLLDLFGIAEATNGEARTVYGFPPVLFLCIIIAAWWAGMSADLGQIRKRIDWELKKMQ